MCLRYAPSPRHDGDSLRKQTSDTDVYRLICSGTPADIFYPLARRYSTSDLFPTWALLDVGSVPDANLARGMRASKNSSPAAMRSDLCCATSCAHRCVARSDLCCRGTAHVCDSAEGVRKYFPSADTWMFVCASAGALHRWATVPTLAKHTSFGHKYFCKLALAQACEGLRRLRSLAQSMSWPKMIKIIKRP